MVLALRLPRTLVASETLRWIVLSARALPVEASKCIDKKFLKPCKQHMHPSTCSPASDSSCIYETIDIDG